jgi:hypothetical protein
MRVTTVADAKSMVGEQNKQPKVNIDCQSLDIIDPRLAGTNLQSFHKRVDRKSPAAAQMGKKCL